MQNQSKNGKFELLGEYFEIRYFPNIYAMVKNNKSWAEEQIRSIADAWHEGNIISAARALESDLNKM